MDTTVITNWFLSTYALDGSIACQLMRSYTNDVYLMTHSARKYVLKFYGIKWRTQSEIEYEVELLDYLTEKGLRVARAVAGKDSRKVYAIPTPEGLRYAVLFEYAEGEKPQPPFSNELYYAFGQTIARMHEVSNDFVSKYKRRPLDLACTVDAPLDLALPFIEKEEDRVSLQGIAEQVKCKLAELSTRGLDWGPIHGDATLDNFHVTAEGDIVLYDFDSGGPGWRAADLQGWARNRSTYAEKWLAFQKGYGSARELKALDLEATPYLAIAWQIWGLQIDLEQRILKQGKDKVADYLARQIAVITEDSSLLMDRESGKETETCRPI